MQKSKLIDRLRLLERDELRTFGKFLESSYHNNDEKVVKLFVYLKKYYPVFEHKKLDRDYIAAKLFPEWKNSAYKKLSYVMSSMSDLLEDFFVQRELELDKLERQQFLLKGYKRRKGDWFFHQTVEALNKTLDTASERGINYYYHKYRLNDEIYTHTATDRAKTDIESFKNTMKNLELFYYSSKFKNCSEVRFRELHFSEKSELILLDEMLKMTQNKIFKDKFIVHIFAAIIRLFESRDYLAYQELKTMIFQHFDQFGSVEKLDMVVMANNFCIIQYNKGEEEYLIEIFELMEYGLEKETWLADGYISHIIFDNIASVACKLKKFEWTEAFIRKYNSQLREEVREHVRNLTLCRLEFDRGHFERTLEILRNTEFEDSQYEIKTKIFQLRSYYELDGYEEVFYDACNAFAQYCRRNKLIGEESRELHLNFISFLRKLHQAKFTQLETKQSLQEKLEQTPVLLSGWLKEKIEQDIKK